MKGIIGIIPIVKERHGKTGRTVLEHLPSNEVTSQLLDTIGMSGVIKNLAVKFIRSELLFRYPECDALRNRLGQLSLEEGFIACSLPLNVLERVAQFNDYEAFNGSLKYFGYAESGIARSQESEILFLVQLLNDDSSQRYQLLSCTSYSRDYQGLSTRTGLEESLIILRLKDPKLTPFQFEGWSWKKVSDEYTRQDVEDVLCYSSIPFPPGISIACRSADLSEQSDRVQFQDEAWINRRLQTLELIIVRAFDNGGLLFWFPQTHLHGSTAKSNGLTVL